VFLYNFFETPFFPQKAQRSTTHTRGCDLVL